jgi:hypothetical protein
MKTRKLHLVSGLTWLFISFTVAVIFQYFVPEKAMFIPALPPFAYGVIEVLTGILYRSWS